MNSKAGQWAGSKRLKSTIVTAPVLINTEAVTKPAVVDFRQLSIPSIDQLLSLFVYIGIFKKRAMNLGLKAQVFLAEER